MSTAVQVQYRRGTATQVAGFTGAQGELVIDTTNNRVVVQDGATAGGWPVAKLSEMPGGFLNKFRNGTMDVWQRGTSIVATTSGTYTADGWIVLPAGASVTVSQAGGRQLTKASLMVSGASSVSDVIIKQRIESYIAAACCGQTVTVQAQFYNNSGAPITPKLTVNHAASQDNWTSPTTDVNAVSLQTCANAAWTLIGYSFIASANAYNGLEIIFDLGNSFGSSSNSVQMTECDIRVTSGIPTGLNGNPPPPELRPIGAEIAFCQRYYYRRNAQSSNDTINVLNVFSSTQAWGSLFTFPVAMWANPAINYAAAGDFSLSNGSGSHAASAVSFDGGSPNGIGSWTGITASGASWTAGQSAILYFNTTSAWIDASAEL
jgi:hypothetical protein